ncbi:hypothetical protein SAMN04488004_13420 [Loktanella salsilacus]|jgi:hypothetical protein|uniref:Uncharacterized protein n=1 Tax=Loktanella salsilacus TaxID=195913 RepID=A0A1I4J8Z5_9RHOB|nr:hypothetical protein [Loktanella salsilacus]SFL63024.1 hypothetical protein SAMN04488004_13420 [Loktanella salsilacus]
MKPILHLALLAVVSPEVAFAEWCDPPVAPAPTTADLAHDFREEFKDEFDQYFRDASLYTACLDAERVRVFQEMQITTHRYEWFLNDSAKWSPSE